MIPADKFEETENLLVVYLNHHRLNLNFHKVIKDFVFHKLNIKSLKKVGNRQPFLEAKRNVNKLRITVVISKQKMEETSYRDLSDFFKTLEEYEIMNAVHISLEVISNLKD